MRGKEDATGGFETTRPNQFLSPDLRLNAQLMPIRQSIFVCFLCIFNVFLLRCCTRAPRWYMYSKIDHLYSSFGSLGCKASGQQILYCHEHFMLDING